MTLLAPVVVKLAPVLPAENVFFGVDWAYGFDRTVAVIFIETPPLLAHIVEMLELMERQAQIISGIYDMKIFELGKSGRGGQGASPEN